jgi:O-antigen/teichoic acid export membrane protein
MSRLDAEEAVLDEEDEQASGPGLGIGALAGDAAIYGSARVILKSLTFLLVPLYARFLTPRDFGVLELVLATVLLVDVFITANVDGVFMRFYFDRSDAAWRRQIISLYLVIETVYPAILIGALIVFSGPLSGLVVGAGFAGLFVIALVDRYVTNIVDLPMILCRARRKPFTFAAYSLIRGVVQVALTVVLLVVWHLGVKGILIASLVSACVAFVVTAREYVRDLTRRMDWSVGREMIAFAWPGIISGVAYYAINLIDRFFVKHYHGLADTGLYGVAFRYSQVVLVVVLAFRMGWPQWHYSWLHSGRHPQMLARGGNFFFFAVGIPVVVVAAWITPLFHLLMPERYWDATPAVAPLGIAAMLTGAYTVFAVGLNVTKRMRLIPPLAVLGAVSAVGFNFLLIPPWSFVGAAWATVGAYAVVAVSVLIVSHRVYRVPWDARRILLAIGLMIGLSLASLAVDAWVPLAPSLPFRILITLLYPALLIGLRFFSPEDLAAFRSRLRRLAPVG